MSLEWVEQNILASPEYYAASGFEGGHYSDDHAIRWEYYDPILGRYTASPGEVSYWSNRFRQVGHLQTVREMWYSDEAVRYRINSHYSRLLLRDADFSGLGYWYPKMVESDINVQVLVASTDEFASRREYY